MPNVHHSNQRGSQDMEGEVLLLRVPFYVSFGAMPGLCCFLCVTHRQEGTACQYIVVNARGFNLQEILLEVVTIAPHWFFHLWFTCIFCVCLGMYMGMCMVWLIGVGLWGMRALLFRLHAAYSPNTSATASIRYPYTHT